LRWRISDPGTPNVERRSSKRTLKLNTNRARRTLNGEQQVHFLSWYCFS
jgi:hypothetical protein